MTKSKDVSSCSKLAVIAPLENDSKRRWMRIAGPETYNLTFDSEKYAVLCSKGTTRFSGLATSKLPKLYIIAVDREPIYVGITRQSMRARFRLGFKATGENGYHGYAWRRELRQAQLSIWAHEDAPIVNAERDIETVEAEIVFLARLAGQWPAYQTEIHFHPSNQIHRNVAAQIWGAVTQTSSNSQI
jgi:hypothetical protein